MIKKYNTFLESWFKSKSKKEEVKDVSKILSMEDVEDQFLRLKEVYDFSMMIWYVTFIDGKKDSVVGDDELHEVSIHTRNGIISGVLEEYTKYFPKNGSVYIVRAYKSNGMRGLPLGEVNQIRKRIVKMYQIDMDVRTLPDVAKFLITTK